MSDNPSAASAVSAMIHASAAASACPVSERAPRNAHLRSLIHTDTWAGLDRNAAYTVAAYLA